MNQVVTTASVIISGYRLQYFVAGQICKTLDHTAVFISVNERILEFATKNIPQVDLT